MIPDSPIIYYGTFAGKQASKIDIKEIPFVAVKGEAAPIRANQKSINKGNGFIDRVQTTADNNISHVTDERNDLQAYTIDTVNQGAWIGKATGNNQNLHDDLTIQLSKERGTHPRMGFGGVASRGSLDLYRQDGNSSFNAGDTPVDSYYPIAAQLNPKNDAGG